MKNPARLVLAALPLLCISLFAPSGASAQGMNFHLEPADGVIPIAKKGGEKCLYRDSQKYPRRNCPVVRITPRFDGVSARPSQVTLVKILPITPSVRISGLERASDAPATTTTTASATLKAAVDAAKAAYDAADAALETKSNLSTRAARANPLAELRDLREKRRAYLVALRAYQAAGDAARAATDAAKRHDSATRAVKTDGTIREEFRPVGYTPLAGDQYAVYGEDYFLDIGEFKLMPDGTIDPPFFEVRGLKVTEERDLTAMIGLYAVTGDLKYNRAAHLGGSIAEIAVKFQAPADTEPTVELYLAPVNEDGGIAANDQRGPHLEKLGAGVIQPVRLKARLHKPRTLESLAADEEIRLKLSELPGILTLPLPRTSAPANPTFQHNNALAGATLTYRGVEYGGMQETLTIAAGESSAVTDAFLVLPNGLGGEWKIPDPVIVDATGAPRDDVAGKLSTVGLLFNVVASSRAEAHTDSTKTVPVNRIASASFKESRRPVEHQVGRGKVSQSMVLVSAQLTGSFNELITMRVRGPSGGHDAVEADFMKRLPDGSFVPLTAGEFPHEYSVVVSQDGDRDSRHYVPVFLHDDGLVEGWEVFRLRFHQSEGDATIPSNGEVTLRTSYASADGGEVRGELELSGTNYGIAVGAGNSITYRTGTGASDLTLRFSDSTGVDGTRGADGIISGDELIATGTWTHDPNNLALSLDTASLEANLEASQFVGCKSVNLAGAETAQALADCELAALSTTLRTIGFKNATATVGEGGRAAGDALTLVITPPLDAPATVEIVAVGVETDAVNLSANEENNGGGGRYPRIGKDFHKVQEVQLRAGAETVVNGARSGKSEQRFLIPHLIDDLVVEVDEKFKLQLRPRVGDPFVVASETADGHAESTVTVNDNDTTTFTAEVSPPGQLSSDQTITLTGRLSAPMQVEHRGFFEVLPEGTGTNMRFADNNPRDGYISGADMTVTLVLSDDAGSFLGFGEYRHPYNGVNTSQTGSPAVPNAAILLPKRGDPGRAHLPWHSDVFFELPKIAPVYAGPDFSETATGSGNTFAAVIRINEGGSARISGDGDARTEEKKMSATVPVKLDHEYGSHHTSADAVVVVTAHYDADGDGPLPPRSVSEEVTFVISDDSTEAKNAEFDEADFNALGITDDEVINRNRVVTTTIAFSADTQRITKDTIRVFSGKTVRGPDIIVVDDDATAGGQVGLHLSLAGADGKPITRLEVGKRTDAFLLAEIRSADGERRVAVESALAVDFSLATGDNLLTAADLGSPLLPGGVVIRSGESRGLSARAFSLAPTKVGAFVFQMRGLAIKPSFSRNPARLSGGLNDGYSLTNDSVSVPPEWGALASGYVAVHHSVSHSDAQRWLATLDADDADVNEGDSGLTAAVTLRDAATEAASAFSRAGSGEALTLHYAIVAPASDLGGATAADLTLATASGDAPRPPCARCETEYDETLTTGSVEIASGASTASIPLPAIVNDTDAEAAERFTLVLTALVDSNGLPPVANGGQIAGIGLANGAADYIIAANDGGETTVAGRLRATPRLVLQEELDLTASIAARRANVSRGVITIMRPENVQGVIRGVVRAIDVSTDGAADYHLGDFFEIPAGEFSTTVLVRARGDDLTERNESFQAEILVTEPLGVAGPASNPEVVLLDTDRPITLEVAEATVSAAEGEFLEIKVQAKQGSDPAPPRSAPVEFILTPSPASATADDLLVTVGGDTRAAASDAELTVTGVLEPDATEASVSFQVADDTDTTDEMMTFTVSLPSGNTVNTLDGAISIGSSAATTATLTAATASAATLVITPTTLTRVYGEAAPTEFAFTVAPASGSAFATGDSASTTFFDSNPLTLAGADDDVAAAGTYRFQFKDADTSTAGLQIDYAAGIDTKYDFVLADAVYTITPKEITFTSTEVDKVYDGSALAPEVLGTFSAGVESGDEAYVYASGGVYAGKDVGDAQTITGFGIGGAQAGNYTLASASSASGDITAREISNLGFDGAVNAHPPGSAAVGTLTPEINRARISADGVVAAEMDDFRAGGLQFTAAYTTAPTERGVNQPVTVSITGDGLADSGAFKAANYTLENTDDVTKLRGSDEDNLTDLTGLIADVAGTLTFIRTDRSPDAKNAAVSWRPDGAGVPNGEIAKYHVRWRTVAVEADAPVGIAAAPAGAWQNTSGASDLGEDVGAATAYTIRGLQPDVGYEVQVVAENEFGEAGRGAYSESVISVGIPPALSFTSLVNTSAAGSLVAEFVAPLVAAGGATTPVFSVREQGESEWSGAFDVNPRTDRRSTLSVSRGTSEIRMALKNDFGTSPWSETRFATTSTKNDSAPPGFAAAGGDVFARSHGGPNIDVFWNPPANIDPQSLVGRYEVQWKPDSAATFAATDKATLQADGRNVRTGRNAYVIRNLGTAEARYQAQVRACNDTGCNAWVDARASNSDRITINYKLGNSDSLDRVDQMIVPNVEALQIGDRSLTVNWRPPLYADGTAIDYGFPITTYRVRWRHGAGTDTRWRNPNGAAGEVVVNPDPDSNARRSHTISGLENGIGYQVEFWSERQREDAAGDAKVEAYISASGKDWSSWVTALRASGSPAENAVFLPRVVMQGIPRGAQPGGVPALDALTLGAESNTINASWSVPSGITVGGYQVRWRPYVAAGGQMHWQVADTNATSRVIAEYTKGDPTRTALRETPYEVQVRARNSDNDKWSAWSASQRITPPVPELLGLRIFAAENAESNAHKETPSVPAFSTENFAYTADIAEDASVVYLTPRAAEGHEITIGKAGASNPTVASGSRSAAISLAAGETANVEVQVSSTRAGKTVTVSYMYALTRGGPPGPPSGVTVLPGTFDLEVAWGEPASGGKLREYRVRWRTAGTDAVGNTRATAPGRWLPNDTGRSAALNRQMIITGLTPDTAYEAQVRAINVRGVAGQWSAPVGDSPRQFTFDVDGSGASDTTDSIIVGRYLIGVRGSALTDGQTIPDGADLEEITGKLSAGVRDNGFDVDRDGRSSAQDGIMIMRYAFGVTSGAGLTEGQTNEDAASVADNIGDLQQ